MCYVIHACCLLSQVQLPISLPPVACQNDCHFVSRCSLRTFCDVSLQSVIVLSTWPSSSCCWWFMLKNSAWCHGVSIFCWQTAVSSSWNCCCVVRDLVITELVKFVSVRDCCVLSGQFWMSILFNLVDTSWKFCVAVSDFCLSCLSVFGGWLVDWVCFCWGCLIDAGAFCRLFLGSDLWWDLDCDVLLPSGCRSWQDELVQLFSGSCSLSYWTGRYILYTLGRLSKPCSICLQEPVVELVDYLRHLWHHIEGYFLLHQTMLSPSSKMSSIYPRVLHTVCTLSWFRTTGERERDFESLSRNRHVFWKTSVHLICFHFWKRCRSRKNGLQLRDVERKLDWAPMCFSLILQSDEELLFLLVFSLQGIEWRMELVREVFCWVLWDKSIGEWWWLFEGCECFCGDVSTAAWLSSAWLYSKFCFVLGFLPVLSSWDIAMFWRSLWEVFVVQCSHGVGLVSGQWMG